MASAFRRRLPFNAESDKFSESDFHKAIKKRQRINKCEKKLRSAIREFHKILILLFLMPV